MASETETSLLPIEDYEAIEEAVMETARGRWFLAEYARRHRHADTLAIVASLERLESAVKEDRGSSSSEVSMFKLDMVDMANAIRRTKQEIAQLRPDTDAGGRFQKASDELDSIVSQTEQATNEILLNAEKIQELAWTLRDYDVPAEICEGLDAAATDIYTGCSFQDLTGQRTGKVVTVLRYLESRINSMVSIWGLETEDLDRAAETVVVATPGDIAPEFGAPDPQDTRPDAHLMHGPARSGEGISQGDIDSLLDGAAFEDPGFDESLRQVLTEDLDMIEAHAVASVPDATLPDMSFAGADVFASPATGGAASPIVDYAEADIFAPAARTEMPPAAQTVRQRVGNTVMEVTVAAETDPAPGLVIVEQNDPIAAMSVGQKLVAFG